MLPRTFRIHIMSMMKNVINTPPVTTTKTAAIPDDNPESPDTDDNIAGTDTVYV